MNVTSAQFVKGIRGTDPIVTDGVPHIAFVGRSNVGKSSLINALTGKKDLVKVSDKPGKTTEINFFRVNHTMYLVDLPGYGYAKVSPKEKEKLRKLILWYLTASGARPELVVLIVDMKVGITAFDQQMIDVLRTERHPFMIVANKYDKLTQRERAQQLSAIIKDAETSDVIPCSTYAPGGIRAVVQRIFGN